MKKNNDKIVNILIGFGVIGALILGILIIFPQKSDQKDSTSKSTASSASQLTEHKFDNMTLKINIDKTNAEKIYNFLVTTLKKDNLPKEIMFRLQPTTEKSQNTPSGNSYVGGFNKDGRYITVLYGSNDKSNNMAYMRVWIMPAGESITQDQAEKLSSDLFNETYISSIGKLTCQKIKNPSNNLELTECNGMKTASSGELTGITVRAPIILLPPPGISVTPGQEKAPKVIIVSACKVPKEGVSFYTASSCI